MMKQTVVFLFSIIVTLSCKSQNPIFALGEYPRIDAIEGSYYKDLNNVLDDFEGTWVYTDDLNRSLELVLNKENAYFNDFYYQDLLTGEYEYKENGTVIMSTLPLLSDTSINGYYHQLNGNNIYDSCDFFPVSDCNEGEKRVGIGFNDILDEKIYYNLVLHKRVINGQEALRVRFDNAATQIDFFEGEERPQATIPLRGELIFYKQ